MRRMLLLVAMAGLIGAAGQASANPTISLVFQGGGTSRNINVGDSVTLDVILVNDLDIIAGTTSVGLSATGIVQITGAVNTSPAGLTGVAFASGAPNGPTGFFGGLNLAGSLAPGTYDMGDITYQAIGPAGSSVTLQTIFTPGIDDWYDINFTNVTPNQDFATINIVPEPATASMLGLGLLGLVLVGRRRS
jgi:hypothetical protein